MGFREKLQDFMGKFMVSCIAMPYTTLIFDDWFIPPKNGNEWGMVDDIAIPTLVREVIPFYSQQIWVSEVL